MILQRILFLSLLCMLSINSIAQDMEVFTIDTLLTYSPEDFSIESLDEQPGSIIQPISNVISFNYGGQVGEPAMPYYTVKVYHPQETTFKDIQYTTQESLFAESFVMALNEAAEPEDNLTPLTETKSSEDAATSSNNIYPSQAVEVAVEYPPIPQFGQESSCTVLRVYPFRYDADGQQLFLNKKIHIQLNYYVSNINTSIHNTPSDSIVHRTSEPRTSFDLSGRRLTTPPTKGIYIRNGKKVVMR